MIRQTAKHVKKTMYGEGTGHDWWHVYRVWNVAKRIAKTEKDADMEVVELGALLHDIKDWKFNNGDMKAGEKAAKEWLNSIDADPEIVDKVCYIVGNVSFRGAGVKDMGRLNIIILSPHQSPDGLWSGTIQECQKTR